MACGGCHVKSIQHLASVDHHGIAASMRLPYAASVCLALDAMNACALPEQQEAVLLTQEQTQVMMFWLVWSRLTRWLMKICWPQP
jgi:hypothetical protein